MSEFYHNELLGGTSFQVSGTATKNATETYVLRIITPATGIVHLHFDVRGTGEGSVALYEDPTITGAGTTVTPVCRRRLDPRTPNVAVQHTPTVSANGTLLTTEHFGSGKLRDGAAEDREWILKPNEDYLIIFTSEAATNELSWVVEWSEV